jgi:hypothetical protein
VQTLGFPYEFRARPWDEIVGDFVDLEHPSESLQHMVAIAQSVRDSDSADLIAGTTSMHDLLVTMTPVTSPPVDVIQIFSPISMRPPASGMVRIEHLAKTGRNDVIERPVADAVPLFWRFVWEKFGIGSQR